MEQVQECEWECEVVVGGWSGTREVGSWSTGLGWCVSVSGSWVAWKIIILLGIVQRAVKRAHALHGADSRSPEKLGCDEWRVGQQWGIGKQAVVGMGQLASIYPVEEDVNMMPRSAGG